jgi:hypothetical protein
MALPNSVNQRRDNAICNLFRYSGAENVTAHSALSFPPFAKAII